MLREEILDPQGQAVQERALPGLGFPGVSGVRIGKRSWSSCRPRPTRRSSARRWELAAKLLANPVLSVTWRLEDWLRPARGPSPAAPTREVAAVVAAGRRDRGVTPVSELQDQVLPRWFVAHRGGDGAGRDRGRDRRLRRLRPREVPVAARRRRLAAATPTPSGSCASATPSRSRCPGPAGRAGCGSRAPKGDRAVLAEGLGALCDAELDPATAGLLRDFAGKGGTVRFAQFADTGVDSTAAVEEPLILPLNNRYAVTLEPAEIAPLVVHDLTARAQGPGTADGELAARRAEAAVCALVDTAPPSRSCADAESCSHWLIPWRRCSAWATGDAARAPVLAVKW